jgi:hypothetical protein
LAKSCRKNVDITEVPLIFVAALVLSGGHKLNLEVVLGLIAGATPTFCACAAACTVTDNIQGGRYADIHAIVQLDRARRS